MGSNLAQRVQSNVAARQQAQAQSPMQSLESTLHSMEQQFQLAMPRGAEAAQLIRDAITVVRNTPKLAECNPPSLLGALMTCAQLGLRPGVSALGHAYILPMWNGRERRFDAQFILGYQGMLELAHRSGDLASVRARIVYQNDQFHISYGLKERLEHEPVTFGEKGPAIGYYAVVETTKGVPTFIFATKAEMEAHRDQFAMAKKKDGTIVGPWRDHFDAMALKTVIRELFKYMPKSTEIQGAIVADSSVRVDIAPKADLVTVSESVRPDEYSPEAPEAAEAQQITQTPAGVDTTTGEVSAADAAWFADQQPQEA